MAHRAYRAALITAATAIVLTTVVAPTNADTSRDPRVIMSGIAGFISSGIANGGLDDTAPINGATPSNNAGSIDSAANGSVTVPAGYYVEWDSVNVTYCVDNSGLPEPHYVYQYGAGKIGTGTCKGGTVVTPPSKDEITQETIMDIAAWFASNMKNRDLPKTGTINLTRTGARATTYTISPLTSIRIPAGYYVVWNRKLKSVCVDNSGTKNTHYAWGIRDIHSPVERVITGECHHRPITPNKPLTRAT